MSASAPPHLHRGSDEHAQALLIGPRHGAEVGAVGGEGALGAVASGAEAIGAGEVQEATVPADGCTLHY